MQIKWDTTVSEGRVLDYLGNRVEVGCTIVHAVPTPRSAVLTTSVVLGYDVEDGSLRIQKTEPSNSEEIQKANDDGVIAPRPIYWSGWLKYPSQTVLVIDYPDGLSS